MDWETIREHYPEQWVLLEALNAYSDDGKRVVEDGAIINSFDDSKEALNEYKNLHKSFPGREIYVVHTRNERLQILERKWMGIRR